jgi:hypothetical protein
MLEGTEMAKNDELPPIGLPLVEPSSTGYFLRVSAMVVACGAVVLAVGYGWLHVSSGPCDAVYGAALGELRAEVDFFRESGAELGLNTVEIQELRASARVAEDSLMACCEQQREGALSADGFPECDEHASVIAALPAQLAAAHGDAAIAKKVVRTAASRLRGAASDLADIASPSQSTGPAGVAAGPPAAAQPDD